MRGLTEFEKAWGTYRVCGGVKRNQLDILAVGGDELLAADQQVDVTCTVQQDLNEMTEERNGTAIIEDTWLSLVMPSLVVHNLHHKPWHPCKCRVGVTSKCFMIQWQNAFKLPRNHEQKNTTTKEDVVKFIFFIESQQVYMIKVPRKFETTAREIASNSQHHRICRPCAWDSTKLHV